jgi:hypothetical protein
MSAPEIEDEASGEALSPQHFPFFPRNDRKSARQAQAQAQGKIAKQASKQPARHRIQMGIIFALVLYNNWQLLDLSPSVWTREERCRVFQRGGTLIIN